MNGTTEFTDHLFNDDEEPAEEITLPQYMATIDRPVRRNEDGSVKELVIESEGQADWALRRLTQYEAQAADVDAQADKIIAEINAWRAARKGRYQRHIDYFTGLLQGWFIRWRIDHPKEKSCLLPSGTAGERAQQPEVKKDDAKLLAWLKSYKDGMSKFIKVDESPKWAELKKECDVTGDSCVYKPTGEEIPAITLVQRQPAFYVKPAGLPAIIEGQEVIALDEPDIE